MLKLHRNTIIMGRRRDHGTSFHYEKSHNVKEVFLFKMKDFQRKNGFDEVMKSSIFEKRNRNLESGRDSKFFKLDELDDLQLS